MMRENQAWILRYVMFMCAAVVHERLPLLLWFIIKVCETFAGWFPPLSSHKISCYNIIYSI